MQAMSLFKNLEQGIMQMIKAAVIYAIHLTAIHRKNTPNVQSINDIMMNDKISGLTLLSMFYSESEKKDFRTNGYLVQIGNQVLLATYTAFEFYLTNKFKEYFQHNLKEANKVNSEAILAKFTFRSLDNIKDIYKDVLGIFLPQFEMDRIWVDPASSFKPKSTWVGIKTIEKARHEIAHEGKSKSYRISLLPDVWDPFDFVRRWVMLFDANFDALVYEGRTSPMVKEHNVKVAKLSRIKAK